MRLLRIILILAAFQVEIRVRASDFISGTMYIDSQERPEVSFLHGQIKVTQGSYLIYSSRKKMDSVTIYNKNADLNIKFRSGQTLTLPPGFFVQIQGLDQNGKQVYSVVQPWDLVEYLKTLRDSHAQVDLKKESVDLREIHEQSVKLASAIYQKVTDRELASLAEQERLKQEELERKKQSRNKLKQLFYERTFDR